MIDRTTVLKGVGCMVAELSIIIPVEDAMERARNIAQVLQDGESDPVEVIREALSGRLRMSAGMQILAIARVATAWTSTVQTSVYRETESTLIDCGTCGGSGGGGDAGTHCPSCDGSGRSRESVRREEEDRAEYLADQAADYDDREIPW